MVAPKSVTLTQNCTVLPAMVAIVLAALTTQMAQIVSVAERTTIVRTTTSLAWPVTATLLVCGNIFKVSIVDHRKKRMLCVMITKCIFELYEDFRAWASTLHRLTIFFVPVIFYIVLSI